MPATTDLVTLEHAKDWAKRLLKSRRDRGESVALSDCQTDVAHMLGHAHWHALSRFYQDSPALPPVAEVALLSWAEQEHHLLSLVNGRYPEVKATALTLMSRNPVQELRDEGEFLAKVAEFKEDGGFYPEVISEALEDTLLPLHPLPGHLWLRVENSEHTAYLVSVSEDDFGCCLRK